MNLAYQHHKMTEEEYLQAELLSDIRHEYIDGEVYAMVGGTLQHGGLVMNIPREIGNHLKDKPCRVFAESIKVKVDRGYGRSNYLYPDVVVDCSIQKAENDMLTTPVLLLEVISDSSSRYDKLTKFNIYKNIPTLQEYITVEQHQVEITVRRRRSNWQIEQYFLGDEITFESIGLGIAVAELYDGIDNVEMQQWLSNKNHLNQDEIE